MPWPVRERLPRSELQVIGPREQREPRRQPHHAEHERLERGEHPRLLSRKDERHEEDRGHREECVEADRRRGAHERARRELPTPRAFPLMRAEREGDRGGAEQERDGMRPDRKGVLPRVAPEREDQRRRHGQRSLAEYIERERTGD